MLDSGYLPLNEASRSLLRGISRAQLRRAPPAFALKSYGAVASPFLSAQAAEYPGEGE